MKKILCLFLLAFCLAFTSSCSRGLTIKEFVDNNLVEDKDTYLNTKYTKYPLLENAKLATGNYIITSTNAVYSVSEDKIIYEPTSKVEYHEYYGLLLIKYIDGTNKMSMITDKGDILFTVFSSDTPSYNVSLVSSNIREYKFNFDVGKIICYYYLDLDKFEIVNDYRDISLDNDHVYNTSSLDDFGLKGYTLKNTKCTYLIYNKKGKLVNSFNIQQVCNGFDFCMMFGRKIFLQRQIRVSKDEDYDYIDDSGDLKYYKVESYFYDILTNKMKKINLNLNVHFSRSAKNDKGINNLLYLYGTKYENGQNIKEALVMDESGRILLSRHFKDYVDLTSMKKVSDKYYIDYDAHTLYDENLNVVVDFRDDENLLIDYVDYISAYNSMVIYKRNQRGVVNNNLEIIIPFNYDDISDLVILNKYVCSNSSTKTVDVYDTNGKLLKTYKNSEMNPCYIFEKVNTKYNIYSVDGELLASDVESYSYKKTYTFKGTYCSVQYMKDGKSYVITCSNLKKEG